MATSFQILAAWLPFISPSDLEQSFQYFQQGNPVNGYISGSTVGNILSRSGLPQDSLSHIWSLSNISNSPLGLSLPEFALSWHLVKLVLNGTILPPVLPDNFKTMLVAAVNNSNSGQQQYQQQQLLQPISTGNTSYSSSSSSGSAFSATSPLAKSINPNQPPLQQQQQQYFSSYNSTAPSSLMQAASSKSSTSSKWAITPAEKSQSDSIFKIWDPNNVGFVDGERARNIFGSSGLSDAMLAHIWNLADTHRHGKLNPDEFAVAMHLVYKKLNGQDLPQTLPLDLVPPSTRDLDDMASLMKKEVINNIINKPKAPTIFQTVAGANDVLANSLRSSTTTSTTLPHSSSSSAIAVYEADRAVQESRIAEMNQKIEQKKLDIGLIKPKLAATQKSVKDVKADIAKLKSDILTTNADIEKRLLSAVAKGATAANPLSSSSTSSTSATSLEISRLQTKALQFMQEIESLSEEQKRISQEKAAQLVESARAKEEKRVAENAKNAAAAASSSASSPAPSAAGVGVNLSSLLGAAAAPGSNPADPVACRTAALLAQRMAALGVGGGTSAAAASTATPVAQIASTLSADLEKIESDRRAQQELLERKVGTASSLVERIKKIGSDLQSSYSSASSGPSGTTSTTWEPSSSEILKYEEGIGILSEEANQLIEDMKKTRTKASAASSNSSIFLNSTTAISSTPSSSLFSSTSSYAANNDTTISPPSAPAPTHPPLIPSYSIDRFSSVPIATSSTPSLPPPPPPSSAASMSITSASYTPTYPSNASITSPDSTGSSAAGDQKRRTAAAVSEALAKAEAAIQAVKDRVGKQIDATSSNPFGSSIGSGNAGNGAAVMNGGDSSNPFSSTNMTLKAGDSNSDPFGQSTSNQQGFERPSVKGELAPATCPTDDVSSSSRTQTTTIVNPSPPTIPAQAPFKIKPQPPHPAPKPKEIPKLPPARPTPVISPDPATVTIVAPPPTTPTYTQQTEIIASAQQQQQIKLEHNKPLGASKVSDLRQSIQASLTSKPTAVESQQPPQIGRDSKTSGISTSSSFASAKKMLEKDLFGGGSFTDNPVSATSSAAVVSSNTQPGITPSKSFNNAKELLQKNLFGAQSSSQLEDDSTDQANNSGPIVVSGAPPPPPPLPPTDNLSSNRSSQASLHSAVSTSNQVGPRLSSSFNSGVSNRVSTAISAQSFPMQASMSQLEKAVATTSIASTTPHNTSSSSKKVDLVSAIKSDKSSSVPLAKKKSVSISPNLDAKSSISISNSPKLVVSVFSEESLSTIEDPSAAIANNVEFVCAYLVKALYDFQGTREDDVPFVAGDVLEVSTENGGWCTGRKQGSTQVGWFPRNFVEEYNIANESAQQIFSSPETSTPTPKKIGSAQALYDYDARRADESTMKFGDLVEIVEKTDENWWKIRIKGAVGLVPASYLKEVVTADSTTHAYQKSPTSSIPLSHDGRASISSQKSNSRISVAHDGVENNRLSVLRNSTVDSGGGSGLPRSFSTSLRSSPSMSFSQPWSSFVSEELLSQLSVEEKKRQEAIYELIGTEKSYVRDLQLIIDQFFQPLSKSLSPKDLKTLFSNIGEILITNTIILSDFEAVQEQDNFFVSCIGDKFLKHIPALETYAIYCANLSGGIKLLQKKRAEDKKIAEFLKNQQKAPVCRNLDLSSFLLLPMQRITRYTLLFKQILHYTPKGHDDRDFLVQTLDLAEATADLINTAAREQENKDKFEEILSLMDLHLDVKLDLHAATKFSGKRQFVYEGDLSKAKSGKKLHAYLFNDLILFAHKMTSQTGKLFSTYRQPFLVHEIAVKDEEESHGDGLCFSIIHGPEVMTLRAATKVDKRQWIDKISTQSQYVMAIQKRGLKSNSAAGLLNPLGSNRLDAIGTLEVTVCEARNLVPTRKAGKPEIVARARLNLQSQKTGLSRDTVNPKWNQTLIFSVLSLDESLKISIYNIDAYSQDDYLGFADVNLNILEYYGEKETEMINLKLKDAASGEVRIQMRFKKY